MCLHVFKPDTTILPFSCKTFHSLRLHVITSHLSMPGETRPFRAPALPRSFDYINTLICTYYVPSLPSQRRWVFCLSAFTCSLCDGGVTVAWSCYESTSLLNGVMTFPNLGCVCVGGRGYPGFKSCFNNTPAKTGPISHRHQKEINCI